MAQFQVIQPETTYSGSPIQPLQKGLPKTTRSLCPECSQLIDAKILEDSGKVVMEKRCPTHGEFRDIVYSDAKLYLKMEEWEFGDNRGLANPAVNAGTRRAAMMSFSPVFGLRPSRFFRSRTTKLPNGINCTLSPACRAFLISSSSVDRKST